MQGHNRIELRSPDSMCNPYLTLALMLAAGLEGIDKQLVLPPPLIENAYEITPDQL